MSRSRPNYFARLIAVLALVLVSVAVVAMIATSGGDSGGGDDDGFGDGGEKTSGPTREGERALAKGVWIVEEGDTLVGISEATGIDLDQLVELNADLDPQALISGQRISLRVGQVGGSSEGSGTGTDTSGSDPADQFGDGSVDGDSSSSQ